MSTLLLRGSSVVPLPALEPSEELSFALAAGKEILGLIETGRMTYDRSGLNAWLSGGATSHENRLRRQKVEAVTELLAGRKLTELPEAFAAAYVAYLATTPEGRATRMFADEQIKRGAAITGLPVEALAALSFG